MTALIKPAVSIDKLTLLQGTRDYWADVPAIPPRDATQDSTTHTHAEAVRQNFHIHTGVTQITDPGPQREPAIPRRESKQK